MAQHKEVLSGGEASTFYPDLVFNDRIHQIKEGLHYISAFVPNLSLLQTDQCSKNKQLTNKKRTPLPKHL
jgi:hypothetical protein